MKKYLSQAVWLIGVVSITAIMTACGSGGGGGTESSGPLSFSTTVIDGAIQNALVCLDKNSNGVCDSGEPQGRTNAAGKATFNIDLGDAGKYPVLAIVGTDAVDADFGPVTTAYTLLAPADQPNVVSPLTMLAQLTAASTGASSGDAAAALQSTIGITTSFFQDYTKLSPPADGSTNSAIAARAVVLYLQQQSSAVASVLGSTANDGSIITQSKLDIAIRKKLLQQLPGVVSAMSDPSVLVANTPSDREVALQTQIAHLISSSGLTPALMASVIATNNQFELGSQPLVNAPVATLSLPVFSYTDSANYYIRAMTGTQAQNTPDANNSIRYVERHLSSNAGSLASWGFSGSPSRQSDLSWDGSAWVACPINHENISSARDAKGYANYNYCHNRELGVSKKAVLNLTGQKMLSFYNSMRDAGFTNITIANAATALGGATFPANSALQFGNAIGTSAAYSYYPGGSTPVGFSNVVAQYSTSVNTGTNAGCTSAEFATTNGTNSTKFESLIQANPGIPCTFSQASFTYGGQTYTSDVVNEAWSNTSIHIGKIGTAPINKGIAPGFYSGNTRFRVAFMGAGINPTTYYACKERFDNGAPRNCRVIGTGSYTIKTLGDARVMTFNNLPAQMAPMTFTQILVERAGQIYLGYQDKQGVSSDARLNLSAANALFTQLGIPAIDVNLPIVTAPGSFEGKWDLSIGGTGTGPTLTINTDGGYNCANGGASPVAFACTLSITAPETGGFTVSFSTGSLHGNFNALTGMVSGTYVDSAINPSSGSFVGQRR